MSAPRVDVERAHLGLLGAHVFERADHRAELGEHRLFGQPLVDRLGDAEVDHLGHGLAVVERHQHVRRLDVAVDDPLLMGVLDRLADGDEQLQPLLRREVIAVAVLGDRHALDQLHHEVRAAGVGGAGVEDAGDVGVVHHRQGLAFGLEAGDDLPRVHARLDDLERHLASDRLLLLGHEDGAHAALADLLEELVRADHRAGFLVERSGDTHGWVVFVLGLGIASGSRSRSWRNARAKEIAGPLVSLQERFHLDAKRRILSARPIEIRRTLGAGGVVQGLREDRLQVGLGRIHQRHPPHDWGRRDRVYPDMLPLRQESDTKNRPIRKNLADRAVETARHEQTPSPFQRSDGRRPRPSAASSSVSPA